MVGGWGRTFIQASLALLAPDDPVRSHQEYQGGGWGHAFAYKGGGWVGARMHIQAAVALLAPGMGQEPPPSL